MYGSAMVNVARVRDPRAVRTQVRTWTREPRIVQIKNQHPSFELFYEYRLSAAAGPSPEDTQTETHEDVFLPVSKTTPLSEMNAPSIFFFCF